MLTWDLHKSVHRRIPDRLPSPQSQNALPEVPLHRHDSRGHQRCLFRQKCMARQHQTKRCLSKDFRYFRNAGRHKTTWTANKNFLPDSLKMVDLIQRIKRFVFNSFRRSTQNSDVEKTLLIAKLACWLSRLLLCGPMHWPPKNKPFCVWHFRAYYSFFLFCNIYSRKMVFCHLPNFSGCQAVTGTPPGHLFWIAPKKVSISDPCIWSACQYDSVF